MCAQCLLNQARSGTAVFLVLLRIFDGLPPEDQERVRELARILPDAENRIDLDATLDRAIRIILDGITPEERAAMKEVRRRFASF